MKESFKFRISAFLAEIMVNQGGVLRYEEKIADWCGWI